MEWTPILAVVGAATGVLSLTWNMVSHFLTGGRLKVELWGGWVFNEGEPPFRVLVESFNNPALEMSSPRPHHAVMTVRATNRGRMPVAVTGWGIALGENGIGPTNPPHPDSSPDSCVLPPDGSPAQWHVPFRNFLLHAEVMKENGHQTSPIRAMVVDGRGRKRYSKPLDMRWEDLPAYFGRDPR